MTDIETMIAISQTEYERLKKFETCCMEYEKEIAGLVGTQEQLYARFDAIGALAKGANDE